jgi:thiol-disulfide isomerase/thioredoxin
LGECKIATPNPGLKTMIAKIFAFLFLVVLTARADGVLPILTVKGEVYSNVTVTAVTATDVYFTHSKGMGNAKLKDLDPKMQTYFDYDPAKDAAEEKKQAQEKILYHQELLLKPKPAPVVDDDDFVAPVLYAKSFRGEPAPTFVAAKWLTDAPDARGKFVLIEYWATWSDPSRLSIPQLNAFQARFKNRLVVIGVTDESEASVQKMTDPHIEYSVAIDQQARMMKTLEIRGIPHCILVDPRGVVRYEGLPGYLDEAKLKHFLDKYQ